MKTMQQLAREIREVNHANGWGQDFQELGTRAIPNFLELIHTEITEIWRATDEAHKRREAGDVIVRCLDLLQLINPAGVHLALPSCPLGGFMVNAELDAPGDEAGFLLHLHAFVDDAMEAYRKEKPWEVAEASIQDCLARLIGWSVSFIKRGEDDPDELVAGIVEANRGRAYRHGDLRS